MKKRNLKAMALLGIGMALASGCNKAKADDYAADDQKTFYEQLTPDAQAKFKALDDDHKKAAMKVLGGSSACKADAQCKGQRERAVEEQYRKQMQERTQKNGKMKG